MNQENISLRHERTLELPKILERLSGLCSCADAAEAALALRPEQSLRGAQRLMNETVDAHMLMARFGAPSFGGMRNCRGSINRAQAGGTLSMRELLDIAEVLRIVRSLTEWRARCAGMETALDERFDCLSPNKYLEERITTAIVSDEEMSDHASVALADIRRKKRSASGRVREQLDKMIRSSAYQKYLQESIVTIRAGRFVVPVRAECRGEVPGLVHDTSASGSTLFVEPMGVVEANNEIRMLESKEQAEIERILTELSVETGSFADGILQSYSLCVELNLIFAKAKLAYEMKASAPMLNEAGRVVLRRARHPLLDPAKAVANDILLGVDFDTLVITGPNTGGKTVALKTLGLLTVMAMCGLMIPAGDRSEVAVFSHVLADIGDEQSIEQSLSTFSAHMTNLIGIFEVADDRSLVLLDELGAGTDPVEGAALAAAVLESLRSRGARLAATTHYAELKAYALETPGVENGSCEFDVATLRPTYRLLIGMPGRSNAFAILERLGMEASVIQRAKELVSSDNARFEQVVDQLQLARQELEEQREEAAVLRAQAEQAIGQAEKRLRQVEAEREKELEKAREQAKNLVERAREQSDRMLGEMEETKKSLTGQNAAEMLRRARAQAKAGMKSLEDTADPVSERLDAGYTLPRPLRVGDRVLLSDIDKKGTVLSVPDQNGNVMVQAGIIKTRVKVATLRLLEQEKESRPAAPAVRRGVESRAVRKTATELDLRGKAADEALMELDSFLDQAIMGGMETVTIIHGKGTGVLRSAVRQHCRRHPSVRTFRPGVYGEGEDGVTVAELK